MKRKGYEGKEGGDKEEWVMEVRKGKEMRRWDNGEGRRLGGVI